MIEDPARTVQDTAAADPANVDVVVTGGAGFIGTAVVRALRAAGYRVTVVDRVPPRNPDSTAVVGDLHDEDVRSRAALEGAGAIVHLAATTSVVGSMRDPACVFDNNVAVTAALLELARTRGIRQFVLASTNAVVGDAGDRVIDEATPLRPLTPYGATKAASEMLLSAYGGSYGLQTCSLRLTNVYGVGMQHKDSLVARLMRAARSRSTLQIYGDGQQRRDFVHVTDVSAATRLAVRDGWTGPVVVGTGESVSVLDLVESVRRLTSETLPVQHVAARAGEMKAVVVDIAQARRLGYEPTVRLDDGLDSLWREVMAIWGITGP